MGFSYTILLKATSKNLKMLRFTVFTVLASVAMLTEAAPGGGYYYKKSYKKPVPAPTVFAPTDEAFAKVADVLPTLTTEQKTAIVARHVIAGKTVKAADVPTASIGTFGGENIDLVKDADGVGVSFNGGARSNVIIADVEASNGVIHAIDSVIL